MHSLKFKSYAKINIGLKILGKRNDGFRNISTLFQEINFYDTLEIRRTKKEVFFDSNKSLIATFLISFIIVFVQNYSQFKLKFFKLTWDYLSKKLGF